MVTINVTEDCGNSPKNLLLKELNIAFARGDIASLTDLVTADLT